MPGGGGGMPGGSDIGIPGGGGGIPGCYIQHVEGKGRGVFATSEIPAHTDIEISPVLLFTSTEYEEHGRHTLLTTTLSNGGTVVWHLHWGLPNVSYRLEPERESIRYTTTRTVAPNEELCIFYGHSLWFMPADSQDGVTVEDTPDDAWGGLSQLQNDEEVDTSGPSFLEGDPDELIPEDELPFTRLKLIDDEAEDELSAVQTGNCSEICSSHKHLPCSIYRTCVGYDTPTLTHLKRIRKTGPTTTMLLSTVSLTPIAPQPPGEFGLNSPYILQVPRSAALTQLALQHKTTFWPTVYAPRKKFEAEPWPRAKVRWAWQTMQTVIKEANAAKAKGELPVVAYVPPPFDEASQQATQVMEPITAHDTRISANHPLRHAVLNVVRLVADRRSKTSESSLESTSAETENANVRNGAHYLLTDLTLFLSHEPCIMCSMALLHSRVKEIFYLLPMEKTGGCGSIACLPKLPNVNHRFGIGRWKPEASRKDVLERLDIGEDTDA
ncbi:cytidine deaminase-like protein [Irpex lacteus]|nr:cytidine deaminase-like protein [Irpex lacteus]